MPANKLHCLDLRVFEQFCVSRGWRSELPPYGAPVVLRMRKDTERDRLTAAACKGSELLALNGHGRRMLAKFHKEAAAKAAGGPVAPVPAAQQG